MENLGHKKEITQKQVAEDGLLPLFVGRRYAAIVLVLAILLAAGILGFILRLRTGFEDTAAWGYYAATFSFLLATTGSAPLAAVILRLTGADWRRPMTRAVELFATVNILLLVMFIPLLVLQPDVEGRATIWMGWPLAPHLYDAIALLAFAACGLLLLYFSAVPDLAARRMPADRMGSRGADLSGARWRGTIPQWRLHRATLSLFGAFYLMLLILVHSLVASDFAQSLVPEWKDSLFPLQQTLGGFQTGLATAVLIMAIYRRLGFAAYIGLDHFWAMGKILLAFSLLWLYFWFSGLIVMWYGRSPTERTLLDLLWFGPYLPLFLGSLFLNSLGPLAILLWNHLRRSIRWPVIVSVMIIVGTFMERVRFYVAAYSVAGQDALEQIPPAMLPDIADILLMVGGISGAALIYLMASRVIPVMAIWEVQEGLLLRARGQLVRLGVWVVSKTG